MSARAVYAAGVAGVALCAVDVTGQAVTGRFDAGAGFFAATAVLALVVGAWVGSRIETRRVGILIIAWLLAAILNDLWVVWPRSPAVITLSWVLLGVIAPLFAHAALAYPTGRISEPLERGWLGVAYAVSLAWIVPPLLFADPSGCGACVPRGPSLLYAGRRLDLTTTARVFDVAFAIMGVGFLVLVARRFRRASPGSLRTLLPLGVAAFFAGSQLVVGRIVDLVAWAGAYGVLGWLDRLPPLLLPLAIGAGGLATYRGRAAVADLVVELGSLLPGSVEESLRRVVGDPTLTVALRLTDRDGFYDEAGRRIELPAAGSGRAVTLIGPHAAPLAALIHDENLTGQRPLLEAAGAAARLALENERLQAELRAQLAELRASRARIQRVGDEERRRLERDLHDGAQQRLLALGLGLQLVQSRLNGAGEAASLLAEAEAELSHALRELRELARGIHPAILGDQGLAAAVRTLADRSPVPVRLEATTDRFPAPVETAAYFVAAEALANVAKHAQATAVTITIARQNGNARIEIADDGAGGANAEAGGGLRGLADRVGALDGRFEVSSSLARGTRVVAEIPCG
jgi:signal transduction histidine kinase